MFGLILAAALAASPTPAPDYSPMTMEAGTWRASVTFYDYASGKVTGHASGTQKNALLANKHWIMNDFDVPAIGKNPEFQGHGVWGYDPVAHAYIDTWVDTSDGAVRTDYGYWDAQKKTMFWAAKQPDGQGDFVDWRLVETFNGAKRTLEFYQVGLESGKPHLIARMTFTRV